MKETILGQKIGMDYINIDEKYVPVTLVKIIEKSCFLNLSDTLNLFIKSCLNLVL
jgi:hypothetical protein